MKNLILKDILIQKKTFLYSVIYAAIAVLCFSNTTAGLAAYIFGGTSIVYLFVVYSNGYDEKNKSEVILNSLPVSRVSIVTAKYAAVVLFFILGVIITGTVGAIAAATNIIPGMRLIGLSDVLAIFTSIGLMFSIYYPLYFKFGTLKLKIFYILLYMFFLFVPNLIVSMIEEHPDNNMVIKIISIFKSNPAWMLQSFTAILVTVVLIISMEISIKIYRNKEF